MPAVTSCDGRNTGVLVVYRCLYRWRSQTGAPRSRAARQLITGLCGGELREPRVELARAEQAVAGRDQRAGVAREDLAAPHRGGGGGTAANHATPFASPSTAPRAPSPTTQRSRGLRRQYASISGVGSAW